MGMPAALPAELLALYPALRDLPPGSAERVAPLIQCMSLPAGTTLFDEHQPCRGFPFLLSGAIRVFKPAANGRELPLYRVLPGDSCIITSSCLLGRRDYNARGATESETSLLFLPKAAFEGLLSHVPFRDFVFNVFADRIGELMQLVEEVAFRRLDQRLANLLLGHGADVRMSHQQLADELGSVREIVSRLLKGFADQRLVRLGREHIEILDPAGLRRVAA